MFQSLYTGPRRTPRANAALLLLGGALFASACDSAVAPDAATRPERAVATSEIASASAEADLRAIVRALGIAMQDRAVRLSIRDALRDSPWNEHKVVLQQFLASPKGASALAAAAHAAGQTSAEFSARVNALPELDFYVPSRDNRRTWQGTPNVVVAGTVNPEAGRFFGFGADGQEVSNVVPGASRAEVALLVQPAESKLRRSKPQARGQGDVIQSAADGERAQSLVWIYPNGDSVVVDIDAVVEGRDPRFKVVGSRADLRSTGPRTADVSPTPVNPSPLTYAYLDHFKLYFGDGGGNVELRVDAKFYGPAGDLYGTARYRNNEVDDHGAQSPSVPLIAHMPPVDTNARIAIHIWEDDCGCWGNDDDHYGDRDYFWHDRDQLRSIYKGSTLTTDLELNWAVRAKSALARYTLGSVWVTTGYSAQASVVALDQYGYRLVNQQHSVTNWYTSESYIASVTGLGGAYADVTGHTAGQTQLFAVVNGTTTLSTTVSVEDPYEPPPCDPYDPYCVQ